MKIFKVSLFLEHLHSIKLLLKIILLNTILTFCKKINSDEKLTPSLSSSLETKETFSTFKVSNTLKVLSLSAK
jgi:hypothetical protein